MTISRRNLLTWSAAGAGAAIAGTPLAAATLGPPVSPPVSALGLDITDLGVRPNSPADQTTLIQRAINKAASSRVPLVFPPGFYRTGPLKVVNGSHLVGVRGAARIELIHGPAMISALGGANISLTGLLLDGNKVALPPKRGLVHLDQSKAVRISDCQFIDVGGIAILLDTVAGEVEGNTISAPTDAAVVSVDARGLVIARNVIRDAGNNGIMIWRHQNGDDGTLIVDNRIENITNRSGGSGQYGNAVNIYRAGNVIVRGNQIRNCAFTAVRGNSAHNLQIANNSVREMGEVAFYSEFGFEGALISNNTVDGAAIGVSVANFNEGGRLAVVSGNLIRNLKMKRPPGTDPNDGAGIGIYAEADTTVIGNVVENAPHAGISLGFGPYLRDVSVTGNVVRKAAMGMTVSVTSGAGGAVISHNVITGATKGSLIGMDHLRQATGDLALGGLERYPHITATGNRYS